MTSCPYPVEDTVLQQIGDTPVVRYPWVRDSSIWIKQEYQNPTGSMKDRIALGMISSTVSEQEENDITIVEASSGNTAGSVALVANRIGSECIICVPETTSPQKMAYVKAFGAELVTCPDVDSDHRNYYRNVAEQITTDENAIYLNQYENQLNPTVHERWTGPELWEQIDEITHIVCPMGTGGTLSGIGKFIKSVDPSVRIVGVDAENSNISTAFYEQEPVEYNTQIEGLGKSQETPTMWFEYIDEVRSIPDDVAIETSKRVARDAGLLIGHSSGGAFKVAEEVAEERPDASIVLLACDSLSQYFDTSYDV